MCFCLSVTEQEIDFDRTTVIPFFDWLFLFLVSTQCYKFVLGADERNWQDARSYCKNQGGNLVSVLNYREQGKLHFSSVTVG